jgi:hypothetical protein
MSLAQPHADVTELRRRAVVFDSEGSLPGIDQAIK